jgi:TPP-dependent pyruvate/acetoin dehydrogenase alpha subunit
MRMRGHSEHDDASYVPPELLEEWHTKDPLDRFERYLIEAGIMDRDALDAVRALVQSEVEEAAEWALEQPLPEPETAFEGVYREVSTAWPE